MTASQPSAAGPGPVSARIILFTGKGGVGKTTTAAATAVQLADRGLKTLLLSTDAAHSLADAIGQPLSGEPTSVAPGLDAVQVDTQHRFEAAWSDVQAYLQQLLAQGGVDPVTAEELTVLPGIDEILALLAVGDLAGQGRWDAVVVDCAPTAETLRLLALPEALNWYLQRVFPVHRALARGLRPMAAFLGRPAALPSDAVLEAVLRLADDLATVRAMLADPASTSVRLVVTPEAVVLAEARRTLTALSLYGYQVDEVVVNRVFPAVVGQSAWGQAWLQAQGAQLSVLAESFAGLTIRQLPYRSGEPVGLPALAEVAEQLYGEDDPAVAAPVEPLLQVASLGENAFELTLRLPLADRSDVSAARLEDQLVVTAGGHRRVLALPSVLRRCQVVAGSVSDGRLRLRFEPDPALWRPGLGTGSGA
ncbi:MAG TPA: ArsA family ATPase [Jatrophihabitans sp.]|nr:ArsA family ATPase [Jatrophihabitans sp.]